MKSQINHLVTGNESITGTNHEVREALGATVKSDNPVSMTIEIAGLTIELKYSESLSGKSWSWGAPITHEQFYTIIGGRLSGLAKKACPSIQISDMLFVTIEEGNKKLSYHNIQPSMVTII